MNADEKTGNGHSVPVPAPDDGRPGEQERMIAAMEEQHDFPGFYKVVVIAEVLVISVPSFLSVMGQRPAPAATAVFPAARRSRAICWTAPSPLKTGFDSVDDFEAK